MRRVEVLDHDLERFSVVVERAPAHSHMNAVDVRGPAEPQGLTFRTDRRTDRRTDSRGMGGARAFRTARCLERKADGRWIPARGARSSRCDAHYRRSQAIAGHQGVPAPAAVGIADSFLVRVAEVAIPDPRRARLFARPEESLHRLIYKKCSKSLLYNQDNKVSLREIYI